MSNQRNEENSSVQQASDAVCCEAGEHECIESMAYRFGHHPSTVWEDPANKSLREMRRNPNVLLAGDQVTIPPISKKTICVKTNQVHRIQLTRMTTIGFNLRGVLPELDEEESWDVLDDDEGSCCGNADEDVDPMDAPESTEPAQNKTEESTPRKEPALAETVCTLYYGHQTIRRTTDKDGNVYFKVPANLTKATLQVGEGNSMWETQVIIGGLDPSEAAQGIHKRLTNLGYALDADACGKSQGELDVTTRCALRCFQQHHGLEPTGMLDSSTCDALDSHLQPCAQSHLL